MNNKLSIERIKQYATDPRMCNISDELRSGMVELLAYREAESKPVAWSLTYTQKDNPNNKHTSQHDSENIANGWRRLHERAGFEVTIQPLYASPVLSQPVPDELPEPQDSCAGYYRDGWNDCRAAVLSASPVLGQTPELTAAAPELLEALQALSSDLNPVPPTTVSKMYANVTAVNVIRARSAIAKATGESENDN